MTRTETPDTLTILRRLHSDSYGGIRRIASYVGGQLVGHALIATADRHAYVITHLADDDTYAISEFASRRAFDHGDLPLAQTIHDDTDAVIAALTACHVPGNEWTCCGCYEEFVAISDDPMDLTVQPCDECLQCPDCCDCVCCDYGDCDRCN